MKYNKDPYYNFAEIEAFIFFVFFFESLPSLNKIYRSPLKSTVSKAALATLSFYRLLRISLSGILFKDSVKPFFSFSFLAML